MRGYILGPRAQVWNKSTRGFKILKKGISISICLVLVQILMNSHPYKKPLLAELVELSHGASACSAESVWGCPIPSQCPRLMDRLLI